MLGDIVPNTTNPNQGPAAQTGPLPPPPSGGYGSSSFGQAKPVAAPVAEPTATQTVTPAAPTQTGRRSGSKVPLILTVVGVLVFISGVSGLFMYALSGS